ncbi:MAG: hypothetical protein D6693_08695 [Planctomycetota bacterium]|nr:MAG: hypothetical protein D6693_08695 [Planctomycetota bacterium]
MSRAADARAQRRRRGPARLALTFTPLIDIVFLLLLYFLLVAQFKSREENLELDLPRSGPSARADPFALPAEPITVTVRSTGDGARDLAVGSDDPLIGAPGTLDEFAGAVARAAREALTADQLVLIRPAPGTRWEHTVSVIHAVKRAGLPRVRVLEPAA